VPWPGGQDEDEQRERRAGRHLERDAAAWGLRVQLHVPPRPAPLGRLIVVRVVAVAVVVVA